jgi:hypothetical protein
MQVNSDRKVNQLISNLESLKRALEAVPHPHDCEAAAHTVDWRAVTVGESLDEYDVVIACLMPLASWGSKYMGGTLWAYGMAKRVVLTADDWQVRGIHSSCQTLAKRDDYFDKTIWSHWDGKCEKRHKQTLRHAVRSLASPHWPFKMLVPCWEGGDLERLRLPAELVPYDPSPFMAKYPCAAWAMEERRRQWVFASLTAKDTWLHKQRELIKWPIVQYGNVRKGQEKVPESALQHIYGQSTGVMSPPHDVSSAGWFRVRFHMAADAGTVMLCGADEAHILGEPYRKAPGVFERMSNAELEDTALEQAIALNDKSWTKAKLCEVVNRVVAG